MVSVKYRHLKGSPHEGNQYDVGPDLERLRAEAVKAFTERPWRLAGTYTRDGHSFDMRGRLVFVGGWPVEEIG